MNYKKHYELLVEKAKNRTLEGYVERHHIIPRCMGGNDDSENLVELTPEEHYVAHQLLCKMYPENYALSKAVLMMTVNRTNNKIYGWVRKRHSKVQSICQGGKGNSQYGTMWIHSLELKESKKIPKSEKVPEGWNKGRVINFNATKQKEEQRTQQELIKQEKLEKEIKLYREYYTLYNKVGWKEFVKQTKYTHSKANLVTRFKRLLPEFVPQNGKKRGC